MRLTVKIFKILMIVVGSMFILLAFDVFTMEGTFWERLGGFLISISPGVVLIVLVSLLWEKELILGIIFTPLGIAMIIFFRVFEEFPEHLMTLIIVGPVLVAGILFIIHGINNKKKE